MLRRNIGHLALAVPDNPTGHLSLLFLRFILPDEAVEHVLLFLTALCSQNPPQILRNIPSPHHDEYDETLEVWLDGGGDLNGVDWYPTPHSTGPLESADTTARRSDHNLPDPLTVPPTDPAEQTSPTSRHLNT